MIEELISPNSFARTTHVFEPEHLRAHTWFTLETNRSIELLRYQERNRTIWMCRDKHAVAFAAGRKRSQLKEQVT